MATRKVHAFAWCKDCNARFDHPANAQALAAQHARRYGHWTTGEVGLAFDYGRREERS